MKNARISIYLLYSIQFVLRIILLCYLRPEDNTNAASVSNLSKKHKEKKYIKPSPSKSTDL